MVEAASKDARTVKVQNMANEIVGILKLTGQESLEDVFAHLREDAPGLERAPVKLISADGSIIQGPRGLDHLVHGDMLTIVRLGVAEHACVIVDLGSTICRVGVVGEELARGQFECSSIAPYHSFVEHVGREMVISMDCGAIHKIWQHAFFNELRVDPKDHAVFVTVPPLTPASMLERITQMMFEDFNVPALMMMSRTKITFFNAHFSTGPFRDPASFCLAMASDEYTSWNTGSVVHLGNKYTLVVPIYQGYELVHAIQLASQGCQSLVDAFASALAMPSNSQAELLAVRRVMMQESPVDDIEHLQPLHSIHSSCIESFVTDFLDGNSWKISSTGKSIGHFYREVVRLCDEDIRVDVCRNIVLSGSLARLPGLSERIKGKMEEALKADETWAMWNGALRFGSRIRLGPCHTIPRFTRVQQLVVAPPEAGFFGAKVFHRQLSEYGEIAMSEYEENGPSVVRRKCF